MHLTVIGTGYVGLVVGVGLADFGNDVTCVDVDRERISQLQDGNIPGYEPGLEEAMRRNQARGSLRFSSDTESSVVDAEVVFIAVGTPSSEDGSTDLGHVLSACRKVAKGLTGPCVVAIKSTVPVGSGDRIATLFTEYCEHAVSVVSNPEFLKEGDALSDFLKPARVLIGSDDESACALLRKLYAPFIRTSQRIQIMDRRSAELAKYASNAMLAVRISFMNELSELARCVGADIESVRRAVGADPRIGNKFLFAGSGFGGSCLPKDLRSLLSSAEEHKVPLDIIGAAQRANARQKGLVGRLVREHYGEQLRGRHIALWGLSFKPKTDDIRESPALEVATDLIEAGAKVTVYDPEAMENARDVLGSTVAYASDMYAAAEGAHGVVVVTEWPEFRRPDFVRLGRIMSSKIVFDGRNIWNRDELHELGFVHYGVGRSAKLALT